MSQLVYNKIGQYHFYSKEEYQEGIQDLKKIKTLMGKGDLTNPKLAAKLYHQLLLYPDLFGSILGEEFQSKLLQCSNGHMDWLDQFFSSLFPDYKSPEDLQIGSAEKVRTESPKPLHSQKAFAGKEQDALNSRTVSKPAESIESARRRVSAEQDIPIGQDVSAGAAQAPPGRKSKKHKKEIAIFLAGMLSCFILYKAGDAIHYKISTDRSVKKLERLAAMLERDQQAAGGGSRQTALVLEDMETNTEPVSETENSAYDSIALTETVNFDAPETIGQPVVLPQYQIFYDMNADIAGWISIAGTVVNYPVMQNQEEPEYYLYRNFDKETDKTGLPFIDYKCDLLENTNNYLIHAHNMKNGSMFAALLDYKSEAFYKEHKEIVFDTIYQTGVYEIAAVFQSKVSRQDEDVFKYYDFIQAGSEEEYNAYIKEIKALSYYDTGVMPQYGDQLVTLSTCDRSIADGRFVVVARKITGGR